MIFIAVIYNLKHHNNTFSPFTKIVSIICSKNRGKAEKQEHEKKKKDLLFSEQERKLTKLFLNKLDL